MRFFTLYIHIVGWDLGTLGIGSFYCRAERAEELSLLGLTLGLKLSPAMQEQEHLWAEGEWAWREMLLCEKTLDRVKVEKAIEAIRS